MPAIACPKCQKRYQLPDSAVGKVATCMCGSRFRVAGAKPISAARPTDERPAAMLPETHGASPPQRSLHLATRTFGMSRFPPINATRTRRPHCKLLQRRPASPAPPQRCAAAGDVDAA